MKKPIVAVIGHTGMVGSQVFNYYKRQGHKTLGFSIDTKKGYKQSTWEELNSKADIFFVYVPTPFNFDENKENFKIVDEVLRTIEGNKIVVIRSTIWPGMTSTLQKKHKNLKLLFNPEFLSRKSAKKDFETPDRQILGFTAKSKSITKDVLKILPTAPYSAIIRAEEAELIKFAHNTFGALRVMYANHLYEVSKKLKIDYEVVRQGFAASKLVDKNFLRYSNIYNRRLRGYGGPCFPKDVASYLEFCKKIGVEAELIKATRKSNLRILKSQGLTEKKAEKEL